MSKQYIKVLTQNLKHRDYQWKFGLNELGLDDLGIEKIFNNEPKCTSNALYICEIKDFFKWMTLNKHILWVAYATIPDDAQVVIIEDKIKTDKVILHEPLIPIINFIDIAISNNACIHNHEIDPLIWASQNGKLDIVESLISHGADIHTDCDRPIYWASSNGHLPVVECLIKHGSKFNYDNHRCLRLASENGNLDVVKCLLYHGGDIHAGLATPRPDKVGVNDYALSHASRNGHLAVVEYLIAHGANKIEL
jgi:hypothetical protein